MLLAFLSDIHANLEALHAVLRFLRRKPIRHWVILGDHVGYGANPNEVLKTVLRLRPKTIIRGNHDRVAAGIDNIEGFNEIAADAALWTQQRLSPYHRSVLRHLPVGPISFDGVINISHGCPLDEDAYVLSDYDAYVSFRETSEPLLFFGHTHLPVIYRLRDDVVDTFRLPPARKVTGRLDRRFRYMINPGSVGQPRDHIPYASFCLFNLKTWTITFYRIPYAIDTAQSKILRAGLPAFLAHRLAHGI